MAEHVFHDAEVNEVVRDFQAGLLFSHPPDIGYLRNIPTDIVPGREDAERFQEPDLPDSVIDLEYNWNDILQRSTRELLSANASASVETLIDFDNRIRKIMQTNWLKAEQQIAQSVGEEIADEIGVWIDGILRQRASCGIIPGHLTERMWTALKSGGVPVVGMVMRRACSRSMFHRPECESNKPPSGCPTLGFCLPRRKLLCTGRSVQPCATPHSHIGIPPNPLPTITTQHPWPAPASDS